MNGKMYTEDEVLEYMYMAASSAVDGYNTGFKKGFGRSVAISSIAIVGCTYMYKKLKAKYTDKHENQ